MQKKYFLIVLYVFIGVFRLCAQSPSTINVSELTDQQIQAIVNEVNARGLTIEQAAQMAQLQGASATQIEELKKRIEESGLQEKGNEGLITKPEELKKNPANDKFSKKATITPTLKERQIFGFQFFNSDKLSFEPPVNIPTPQNYTLGIDDELSISVWGASQKNYKLKIETSGAINLPDLGPIYILGMEFSKAKELIKRRLVSIYQDLGSSTPNTFCEIAIANLRSITINVIGEVKVPGTYTLASTASAFNALYLSGGPNENGSFRNIQVIRDNKVIKTIDVYDYLINGNTNENIQLREQDIIYIPVYQTRVSANGAFKRRGFFELAENEKLSDLIRYTGGFNENAFKSQLSIIRITEKEKKMLDINQSIYDSFIPHNGDSIIASQIVNHYENRVNISGAVFHPGNYELTEGLTLSDLIKKAQGLKENYYNRGLILRLQKNLTPMTLSFNVEEVISGKNDIQLQREDQVIIQDIFKMKEKRTIQIFGEVQFPGEYDFADNMTLKDLIFKAGGFKEAASESFIELARRHNYEESNNILDELVKLYEFNIDRDLNIQDKEEKFILAPFDYVYVRKSPSYHIQRTVFISGEVSYPGAYSIGSKKERVSDLIKRAGGLMPNAYVNGAHMKRINNQMEQNINILQNTLADSLLVKVEKQINNSQLELRLESILRNPGTEFDYLLKEGDEIIIPEASQEVRISGEIRNPIGLAYEEGRGLKYYVNRNGGFGEKAKKNKVFVIYSDGTTKVTKSFLWPVYPSIEPGSQIVIPPKPEKQKTDSTAKWLAIASTIATMLIAISTFK